MGLTMDWIRAIRKLQKLNKEMKKNPKLKEHFDKWLEEKFKTNDEKKVLAKMQKDPILILEIIQHYEEIKEKY